MRRTTVLPAVLLAVVLPLAMACTNVPPMATSNPATAPGMSTEVFVKRNHDALIADIEAGGGPALANAYDLAGVNAATRDIATLRLQSELPLYRASPAALGVAIRLHAR